MALRLFFFHPNDHLDRGQREDVLWLNCETHCWCGALFWSPFWGPGGDGGMTMKTGMKRRTEQCGYKWATKTTWVDD